MCFLSYFFTHRGPTVKIIWDVSFSQRVLPPNNSVYFFLYFFMVTNSTFAHTECCETKMEIVSRKERNKTQHHNFSLARHGQDELIHLGLKLIP